MNKKEMKKIVNKDLFEEYKDLKQKIIILQDRIKKREVEINRLKRR